MDDGFQAPAEPIRRALLVEDGPTSVAPSAPRKVSRRAGSKHLLTLETVGLVVSPPRGRDGVHHLNPAPLHDLSARGFSRFERHRPGALAAPGPGADDPA